MPARSQNRASSSNSNHREDDAAHMTPLQLPELLSPEDVGPPHESLTGTAAERTEEEAGAVFPNLLKSVHF